MKFARIRVCQRQIKIGPANNFQTVFRHNRIRSGGRSVGPESGRAVQDAEAGGGVKLKKFHPNLAPVYKVHSRHAKMQGAVMQFFRQDDIEVSAIVGWGVRVMLLSAEAAVESRIAARLAGLGGVVEAESDSFAALDLLTMDATGFGLLVIDCDHVGGLEAARKLISMMHKGDASMPVILVSSDCKTQEFPSDYNAPVVLRAPLSAVAVRVGFEHAMRDRLVFQAA